MTNSKVTLYKTTCDNSYMMDEQGTSFSLTPWGNNTAQYQGYDDGGKEYVLPTGYELADTKYGEKMIFHGETACQLQVHSSGRPQLVSSSKSMPVLDLVTN